MSLPFITQLTNGLTTPLIVMLIIVVNTLGKGQTSSNTMVDVSVELNTESTTKIGKRVQGQTSS
jgi:hypothetical protein